ncbi:MAG: tetratricopeptide repeat protein [Bacteroidaceae bacterium]|nr:tetratricopeptide repeat protein [Bacteroidaceae bacterium]
MKRLLHIIICLICCVAITPAVAQISTERVMSIGRNALQFEDYVLSIQYFNQVIKLKPYWADPYFYRAVAKLNLDDYRGAEDDVTECIKRNPYFNNVFYLRGVVRQNMLNYEGAIADYKEALIHSPANRELLNNLAIAYVQSEQFEAADSAYNELIHNHPSYAPAYVTRGQFYLMRGDTIAARADYNRAIELNKNMADAYVLRAMLSIKCDDNLEEALRDMDMAVRLEPKRAEYYINRALVKYYTDDLRGAMSDYDHAQLLDPSSVMVYYNRGLLRAQVGERNRAIDDFTEVLKREPHNYLAVLNRAILYEQLGRYDEAIADFDTVLEVYPEYVEALFSRSEAKRKNGDMRGGESDFSLAMKLQEQQKKNPNLVAEASEKALDNVKARQESDKNIGKYDRLMVADDDLAKAFEPKYESKVRGRVQDRNVMVSLQPIYQLSYYERPNELRPANVFSDELDRLNEQRAFARRLVITNDEAMLESDRIAEHFASAIAYGEAIDKGRGNALLNHLGRSIDLMLLQDYPEAIQDLEVVVEHSPNFMLAYFQRAVLRYKNLEYQRAEAALNGDKATSKQGVVTPVLLDNVRMQYDLMYKDLTRAIELSPRFAYAYYNRANISFALEHIDDAIADYNEVLRLQPDMADAYFNRGLAYLKKGDEKQAREDLSRAGELGVMTAYNLLKRLGE